MKLLKSFNSMFIKRHRGMTEEEATCYQEYKEIDHEPTGEEGDVLIFNASGEKFYHWLFYEEDLKKKHSGSSKHFHIRFREEIEQERYELYCGGWIDFYDQIVLKATKPGLQGEEGHHKLFFFWDRKDIKGVAIYINDESATKYKDRDIQLQYTPPTVTGDPPGIPKPPPPSSK